MTSARKLPGVEAVHPPPGHPSPSAPVMGGGGQSSPPAARTPQAAGGEQDPGSGRASARAARPVQAPAGRVNAEGRPRRPAGNHPGPRTWVIELPAGIPLLSLNGRLHWRERNARNQIIKEAVIVLARKARLPRMERVSIVAEYQPPDRRRRDPDNIALSAKAAIDGIAAAKVLPSDDSRHVASVRCEIGPVYPRGRLVLRITEVPAGAEAGAA